MVLVVMGVELIVQVLLGEVKVHNPVGGDGGGVDCADADAPGGGEGGGGGVDCASTLTGQ